jgi:hypothetical protein
VISFEISNNLLVKRSIADKSRLSGKLNIPILDANRNENEILSPIKKLKTKIDGSIEKSKPKIEGLIEKKLDTI